MDALSGITNSSNPAVTQTNDTGKAAGQQAGFDGERMAVSATSEGIRLPEDRVSLSGRRPDKEQVDAVTKADSAEKEPKTGEKTTSDGKSIEDPQVLQQVDRLKQIEEKVKAHEAAHKAVGGNLASSASYSYTQGPDGRSYITGGEVQIDMSGGRTPQETISKMQQVIRAALAPADPSGQDRAVAAQAATQMAQAQQEQLQTESPTAEPDLAQPIDPSKEAIRAVVDPSAAEDKTTPDGNAGAGSQARQAYGNPAVQGNSFSLNPSGQRHADFSRDDTSSVISAFA